MSGPVWLDRFRVEMNLAQDGGATWTDITADVVLTSEAPLMFHHGIEGAGPTDRCASIGWLTFTLNNSERNSAHTVGYYAPLHASCRSGFTWGTAVRVIFGYGLFDYTKFLGRMVEIDPAPGIRGERVTRVRCVDFIGELAAFAVSDQIPAQVNQTSGAIFSAILNAMPAFSMVNQAGGAGHDTYAYALDDAVGGATALSITQSLVASEFGWVYLTGQRLSAGLGGQMTITFEERNTRDIDPTVAYAFAEDELIAIRVPTNLDLMVNRATVTVHPRTVDTSATTVLAQLQSGTSIEVPPHGSKTVWMDFRDPNQTAAGLIGGTAVVSPVVAITDYLANTIADGSGDDRTASITVTMTAFAASAQFVIDNTIGATVYVTKLQLRGKGIYDYGPARARAEDIALQETYGLRAADLDMPYQNDIEIAQGAADFVLSQYKTLFPHVLSIDVFAHRSAALLTAILALEPGARVTVDETVTGISSAYSHWIQNLEFEVRPHEGTPEITARFGLVPSLPGSSFWLLGTVGSSELGTSTYLGYF